MQWGLGRRSPATPHGIRSSRNSSGQIYSRPRIPSGQTRTSSLRAIGRRSNLLRPWRGAGWRPTSHSTRCPAVPQLTGTNFPPFPDSLWTDWKISWPQTVAAAPPLPSETQNFSRARVPGGGGASTTRNVTGPATTYGYTSAFIPRPPTGSIFGSHGGRRDGRGSLARANRPFKQRERRFFPAQTTGIQLAERTVASTRLPSQGFHGGRVFVIDTFLAMAVRPPASTTHTTRGRPSHSSTAPRRWVSSSQNARWR